MSRTPALLLLLALAGAISMTACSTGHACPASGFVAVNPVELDTSGIAGKDLTVSACYGVGCIPQPVTRDSDGRWMVPQNALYLQPPGAPIPPGGVQTIKVTVVESNRKVIDREYQIPRTPPSTDSSGCPTSAERLGPVKI